MRPRTNIDAERYTGEEIHMKIVMLFLESRIA